MSMQRKIYGAIKDETFSTEIVDLLNEYYPRIGAREYCSLEAGVSVCDDYILWYEVSCLVLDAIERNGTEGFYVEGEDQLKIFNEQLSTFIEEVRLCRTALMQLIDDKGWGYTGTTDA